ncbi:cupin domain-containing protein [Microbispora sp. ATCC PTA-5024]|uniref:cupin domain-containing protein n=1 Tax=Microbispora sp. ATCC PTA-5024 TaxID=316330 RepID=UPI0003DDEDB7|nr:cupin domain-containing protein [Microbispora sp. ATCC PTA-5024]ETK34776.1 cupin [Microbispora sp. ATCC PTA-5024]
MRVMTLAGLPGGPSVPAADDAEALRVAAAAFTGPEPVVAVDDDGRVRFLRRDVTGAFVAVQERPPVAEALGLLPHPEGGWYRETWRTAAGVEPPGYGGRRSTATGIYFLLQPGEESVWHCVRSDEVWFWHRGGPLALVLGGAGERPGAETVITLGPDVEDGQVPQALVPAGTWQAARPAGAEDVLVSCVVSPGFDFADFTAL